MQRLIESELVTELAYRCGMDLDEAKRKLERDAVPGSVIDALVNERLLHIEEHCSCSRSYLPGAYGL